MKTDELTDNELIKRMRADDTGALGILYMRYAPTVNNFAYRFIRIQEDVDDITHNVFCALWENKNNIQDPESLKSYLFIMTRNAIFKAFRHNRIRREYEEEIKAHSQNNLTDGEKLVSTKDLLEMIELMVSRMSENQRKAFRMSRYEHKTYDEIAERLGVSPKTVQYYISQALAELRKLTEVMLLFTSFDHLNF